MAHDALPTTTAPTPATPSATTNAPLARLYALWCALHAYHRDAPGAAGIDYSRPVVQCTPTTYEPTVLSGGHRGPDPVMVRLAAIPNDRARAALVWLRGYPMPSPSTAMDRDEVLRTLLEACADALADDGDRLAWAAAAALRNLDVRGTQAHVRNLARTYARARLAQACEVWER